MLKIGIIGVGHLGKIHLKCIRQIPEYTISGFYDTDETTAIQVAAEFGIHQFDSIDELIRASDVVDIVTPTVAHYRAASASLKRQKHVFIEKPVVATPPQALKLIEQAGKSGVKVQVGHVERFNPAMIAARPFIERPMFIEAHRLSEFKSRGSEVPVILDLMIHDIDIVLNIVKSDIHRISASGVAIVSTTADIANARLEFDNGCVANLTASRLAHAAMRKTRIFQPGSYISIDFLNKKTEVIRLKDAETDATGQEFPVLVPGNGLKNKQMHVELPAIDNTNAIKHELESFAASIMNNTRPEVTIREGYHALEVAFKILEQVQRSVKTYNKKLNK